MSSLIVQVRQITKIRPHQNPAKTRIEIAEVEGWQCIVPVGRYKVGDKIVYFPPDTVLSQEWTDKFGVTQYTDKGRIRTIKIDKEMSFGLITTPEADWAVGDDVAEFYGAKKYEPPLRDRHSGGPNNPPGTGKKNFVEGFHKYTDLEHIRHFADALNDTEVVVTEKIHGCNWRAALINGKLVVGSRNCIREYPAQYIKTEAKNILHGFYLWCYRKITGKPHMISRDDPNAAKLCWYWHVFQTNEFGRVEDMLRYLESQGAKNPALYGESYGPAIQDMHYGLTGGELGFRAFDISIDGKYLSYDEFMDACDRFGILTVPLLYRGPYSFEHIKQFADGKTLLADGPHLREGCVIKPVHERVGPNGRFAFKLVGNDYLLRKENNEVSDSTDN